MRVPSASAAAPARPPRTRARGALGAAFVALAALWAAAFLLVAGVAGNLGWDLRYAYLPAAEAVWAGGSPYPALDDPILEAQKGYVYPPQLAVALAPLSGAPVVVLVPIAVGALLALVVLTLRILEVRDPRCYAAAFASVPVLGAASFANLSIPLALALALAWRYRRRAVAGLALGLAMSAKLVLWPTLLWAGGLRRWGVAATAVASALLVTGVAWAAIGFQGLRGYPALLERLTEIQAERSYSLLGVASALGLPASLGRATALLVGLSLLAACLLLARRGDDFRALASAVAASLALSPIVWMHYLVALFVPLAIARPRFSWLWLLPLLLWLSPRPGYAEGAQQLLPALVAASILACILVRPGERARA